MEAYPLPLRRQSRGGFEFDDRQIRLPFEKGDQQLEHDTVITPGFDGVGFGVDAETEVHGNMPNADLGTRNAGAPIKPPRSSE